MPLLPLLRAQLSMPALLRHAHHAYGAAMRSALAQAGYDDLPENGLYVIGGLAQQQDGRPLGQIIAELGMSKQAAGQLVDALVARGYLDREVDVSDRRRLTITLTEHGRSAARIIGTARATLDATLLTRINARDIARTRRTLEALFDAASADKSPTEISPAVISSADATSADALMPAGAVIYAKNLERMRAFYEPLAELSVAEIGTGHVVLAGPTLQLMLVTMPDHIAASITIGQPPTLRTETPIKLIFPVSSLANARTIAARLGGEVWPATREWSFRGDRICDGFDPEGNVFQLREANQA